jgi:putative Mn2+ efflux pump MntP
MKDNQPAEKYKRYVGGIGTWLPIICGLAMSINAAAVDFSLKAVILNDWFGPVLGRSIYLLVGLLLIAIGLTRALGFPREHKKIEAVNVSFSKRLKKHGG